MALLNNIKLGQMQDAPENVGFDPNKKWTAQDTMKAAYGLQPSQISQAMLGAPQAQQRIDYFDLPDEAKPFTLKQTSSGKVIPQYNLGTRSGMAYAMKAQGIDDNTIAQKFGLQDPSQIGQMIQADFAQLKQKYGGEDKFNPSQRLAISKQYGLPYGFTEEDLEKATPIVEKKSGADGKVLPSSAIEGMAGLMGAIQGTDKLLEEKSKVDTGLLAGPAQGALDVFSAAPAAYTSLAQTKDKLLGDFQKAMSGLTVSDKEAARIEKLMPSVTDNDEKFINKARTFKAELEKLRENQATLYSEGGYNVPKTFLGFGKETPSETKKPTQTITAPDGQVIELID